MKVVYVTGTRADFGLMRNCLMAIDADSEIALTVLITGQHLSALHGNTSEEVLASGLRCHKLKPVPMEGTGGAEMASGLALQMFEIVEALEYLSPDLVLVLGDRGEMLASCWAALLLGIPTAHFHGGERSGTVDDAMRHAISSLCEYHFAATSRSAERLQKTGEIDKSIFVVGAPGLDDIQKFEPDPSILKRLGLEGSGTLMTVLFHPVVQDSQNAAHQAQLLLDELAEIPGRAAIFAPNSDAGAAAIREVYNRASSHKETTQMSYGKLNITWINHLKRDDFLALLAASDLIIGNSSSGIIEAASLNTVTVNIGDRQNMRERNKSVFDCSLEPNSIRGAVKQALEFRGEFNNVYDKGGCASVIVDKLKQLPLGQEATKKKFKF